MIHTYAPHQSVWIPNLDDDWVEATVIKQEGDQLSVRAKGAKGAKGAKKDEQLMLAATECFPKEDGDKGVDDMTKLAFLDEPGVLHNLYLRYQNKQIYTYTGTILIAVNPFARVPGLYEEAMKEQYQGAAIGDLAPHVFAIADAAYRAMIQDGTSQSVLISGESGAGKTETTKLVMEYLAGVGGHSVAEGRSVESKVLESNPILEAFGNAKTLRNNNSSRFGKFIEIQFDDAGRVSGALIKSYLLERSRVVSISEGERNYHCFYQLCHGADAEEVSRYLLPLSPKRAEMFHYLNQSSCFQLDAKAPDAHDFKLTKQAMAVMGMTKEEMESVFTVVAAILHLGNVEFKQTGGAEDPLEVRDEGCKQHLDCVSLLLKCDRQKLEGSLGMITRRVAGQSLASPVDPKTAAIRRDSLAKNLYSTLFDCMLRSTKAETYARQLFTAWGKSPRFSKPTFGHTGFNLAHYAGSVTYSVDEFISKNVDVVIPEHFELLASSTSPFVQDLFPADKVASVKGNKFVSLGTNFKIQLGELMATLNQTEPHYIRCVKPNLVMKPNVFEKKLVNTQLRSGGVLEAVRMCSLGYPTRRSFEDFVDRFGLLVPSDNLPADRVCVRIMAGAGLANFQVGLTKLFLRAGQMVQLETLRLERKNNAAQLIQRHVRHHQFRRQRAHMAFVLQTRWRAYLVRRDSHRLRQHRSAILIQRMERGRGARQEYKKQRQAALTIQAHLRTHRAQDALILMREERAATTIQSAWRGYKDRRPLTQLRRYVRGRAARRKLKGLKAEAARLKELAPPRKKIEAIANSMRLMVYQKLREKAEKARNEALCHLATANSEIEDLKAQLAARGEECSELREEVADARLAAVETATQAQASVAAAVAAAAMAADPGMSSFLDSHLLPPPIKVGPSMSLASSPCSLPDHLPPVGLPSPTTSWDRPRGRLTREGSSIPAPTPKGTVDSQAFDKLMAAFQKEAESSAALKAEVAELGKAVVEGEERLREAGAVLEEVKNVGVVAEEKVAAKETQVKELETKVAVLQDKLAGKERLEQEVKVLGNRILAMSARKGGPMLPPDKQQEVLLKEIRLAHMGFSGTGRPVAAVVLYKALIHWKTFQVEKTNTFDRIVETFQVAERDGSTNVLCYWLSNTATLYFLVQHEHRAAPVKANAMGFSIFGGGESVAGKGQGDAVDTMLFKVQLGMSVERLYITIRDAVKADLLMVLNGSAAASNPAGSREGDAVKGRALRKAPSISRRTSSNYWGQVTVVMDQIFHTLLANFVPPFLVYRLLRQVVGYMDVKIFNSLMVRSQWCPCNYSNGEALESGLLQFNKWAGEVDEWVAIYLEEGVPPLNSNLCHVQEAASFLLLEQKPSKSIDEIRAVCPSLSMNQVVHMCIWYDDDKYGTRGVEAAVIERMWQLMVDDSPMLLRDEDIIPFTIDEVMGSMEAFELDDITPPDALLKDGSFLFLLPKEEEATHTPSRVPSLPLWPDAAINIFGSYITKAE